MTDDPAFPRLSESHGTARLTRTWYAPAWAGPADSLIAIQAEVEDALNEVYNRLIREIPEDGAARLTLGFSRSIAVKSLQRELSLDVLATGDKGQLKWSGSLSSIFAETTLAEIETLVLQNQTHGSFESLMSPMGDGSNRLPQVKVSFTRNPRLGVPSVEVSVSGPDRHWVRGIFDSLVSSLRKNVPRWAIVRRTWFRALLSGILAGVIVAVGISSIATDEPPGVVISAFIFLGAIAAAIFYMILDPLLMRLFPGFEVVEVGASSKGRQVFTIIASLIGGAAALASIAQVIAAVR